MQGSNTGLPQCRQILYQLSHKGSPTEVKHKSPNMMRENVVNRPCVSLTPNMIAQLLTGKKEELGEDNKDRTEHEPLWAECTKVHVFGLEGPHEFKSIWFWEPTINIHSVSSVQLLSHVWLRPRGPQHARPPCPSLTLAVYSNSCPLSRWCHATISSSVIPFSTWLQSLPASRSLQMSQLFPSGDQRIGVSASASVLWWTFRSDLL